MSPDAMILGDNIRDEASGTMNINPATMNSEFASIITKLMNGLFRSLGHAVIVNHFEKSLRVIFGQESQT